MGITCACQQRISEDYEFEDPQADDINLRKKSVADLIDEKIQEEDQDHQKEQQTAEFDPIQLKSYHIQDNCPQGLQPLTVQTQEELFNQYSVVVKKMLQKLPKLEIKANLSPNYKRIPHLDTPYQLLSGDIYVGQWAEGKPFGLGKIYYVDLTIYEGQVVDGIPDGVGRKIYKDGSIYTGLFKIGEITGRGKFVESNDGFKYEGEFLNGKPDGIGVETWPDQTTYQGSYLMGKKHGRGTFTWGNRRSKNLGRQETYVGDFQNDLFHGQGVYTWPDGRVYDGEWVDGKMEGKGQFIWHDKRKYIGSYLKDLKSGRGVLEWPDGKRLAGFWRMGKLNGIATLTIKGKIKEGENISEPDRIFLSEWEDGKRIRWIDSQSNPSPSGNISYNRNFDERLQRSSNQFQPSQYQQDNKQQVKTIFQLDSIIIPSEKLYQKQQSETKVQLTQKQQSLKQPSHEQENQNLNQVVNQSVKSNEQVEKSQKEIKNRKDSKILIEEEQKIDQA